ncbi:hypothetical protein PRUPE_1G473500 [Prunus persica]|uniref:U-box domain-containing protein n=1 Tax=Prunus persica TaxID=3760 RepID=A0A251RE92_PRUPE|nr:hypothetical protein PRUPE_1G473500 [Prunus persica]
MSSARVREVIRQCLSEAQSSDFHEAEQKALQTLVSITKVSPLNRNLLALTEGAIPALLTLSKSSSDIIQILSLSILFNLSLNPDLNLAMLDKNKAKFGVAGTIQLLVKAIAGPRCPAAHHLLSSLAELVRFHGNCTLAVREGAVQALIQVVESTDGEDLAGTSLLVLALLARFDEGLNALRKTDQIVSKMVDVLKGRCMLSKEGAAEILLLLFEESEGCVRDALRLPDFSTLIADISVRGSARAREKAALLLKKIMDADLDSYVDGNPMFSQW